MKVSFHASLKDHGPRGTHGAARISGAKVYEFEVNINGDPPVFVSDCLSPNAFDTIVVQGDPVPRRPCPIRCKKTNGAPPKEWLNTGLLKPGIFQNGGNPVLPGDLFYTIRTTECVKCHLSDGVSSVALEQDRKRIFASFAKQLKVEDFSSFPELCNDHRDHNIWVIYWNSVSVG